MVSDVLDSDFLEVILTVGVEAVLLEPVIVKLLHNTHYTNIKPSFEEFV